MNDSIVKCIEKLNGPAYYFDEAEFVENYHIFENTFKNAYENYKVSYSFKTNYTPYICQLVKSLGGYAEVVSDMELSLAKRIGYESCKIIYNGPYKGGVLEEHLLNGGICNIDNLSEAIRIVKMAKRYSNNDIGVGLRINVDLGCDSISRFGFSIDGEDLQKSMSILKSEENIHIIGIHCHIGHARDLQAWRIRVDTVLSAVDKYIDGIPQYISLGSGMFGRMDKSLADQFECYIPTYKEYADITAKVVNEKYINTPSLKKPILFTEPGATIVSAYMYFACNVTDIKSINGKHFATTNGSVYNIGEISRKKNLPIVIVHKSRGKLYPDIDIVGYTCLEYDHLFRNAYVEIAVGDTVVFGNVGGYSIVSKPQFIMPNYPAYAVTADGNTICMMREEKFEDVFNKFIFEEKK